jgi:hypothetical protein
MSRVTRGEDQERGRDIGGIMVVLGVGRAPVVVGNESEGEGEEQQ